MIKTKFTKFVNTIEADNKAFDSASKAEKRVKIAKDVIARVKTKQIIPASEFLSDEEACSIDLYEDESYKELANTTVCRACAKGALFLAYVGRVNNLNGDPHNSASIEPDSVEMQKLTEIFSQDQLDLMEMAFEGTNYSWMRRDSHDEEAERAYAFNRRRTKKESRMIAVCENIIKNNGTFIP